MSAPLFLFPFRIPISIFALIYQKTEGTQSHRRELPSSTAIMLKNQRYKSAQHIIIITISLFFIRHVTADDADVMAALARSLIPTPSGWTGPNFCEWQGISCDKSKRVTSINLSSRSLSGTLPQQITQLSSLQSLSLQRNQLSGPLPSFSNHSSLEDINLDFNNFNSTPPDFLSGLTSLQTFSINNNSYLAPWRIPETLRDSTSLTSFIASRANVIGEIPDIFDSFPSLQTLRLSYNNMNDQLPRSFAGSPIQNLSLNNAGFSGRVDVLGSMTQLREVWLHVNNFSGPIPDLSACSELVDLQLRDNSLRGIIPDSLTRLENLHNIELQNNVFQGPVPSFRTGVQVSLGNSNKFCRPDPGPCDPQVSSLLVAVVAMGFPSTLVDSWEGNNACQNWRLIICDRGIVTTVNFARQNWTGIISPAFANLTGLRSLLLNDNNLVGTIPVSLTNLRNLELLDISSNNISGKVPPFASSVTVRTFGNPFIGRDVPITYPPGIAPPMANESNANNKGPNNSVSPWVIIVPILVLVFVIPILGFVIYRFYFNKKDERYKWVSIGRGSGKSEISMIRNDIDLAKNKMEITSFTTSVGETPKRSSSDKSEYHVHDGGNVAIPIEILREVANNFNEKNIIGKGGFGIVYKGQLHDGTRIAIKRMESSLISNKGLSEFKAEIEVLTRVRHRNLVALHGFCDNGNERLLVYEYMSQGCLGQHLFEWRELGIPPLPWNQRVIIALDIARGVEYLHSLAQQSFIHRDLKPSNILLGDDMRAKVSDFGLVKSTPDGNYSLETRLAGTFGYLAPEYADVFAFGVVLLEILTGRKALDDSLPDEESHLVTWFRRFLLDKEAIRAALDPVLQSSVNENTFQSILKVTELAGHCTARESHQRPDMSHAVNVLSPLVEQWTPAPNGDEEDSFRGDFQMSLPQVLQKWKDNEDSTTMTSTGFYNSYDSSGTSLKPSSLFTSSNESTNFDRRR